MLLTNGKSGVDKGKQSVLSISSSGGSMKQVVIAFTFVFASIHLILAPATAYAATRISTVPVQINEVMFRPTIGSSEWVELTNTSANAVNLRGFVISDEDGTLYRIPLNLPDLPTGAFVVVYFDGLGASANELDFSDNVAVLHSAVGQVDVFEDDADQVGLYEPVAGFGQLAFLPVALDDFSVFNPPVPSPFPTLPSSHAVDFVAWGSAPNDDAASAQIAGIWNADWFVSLYRGLGMASDETLMGPGETIGRARGATAHTLDSWTLYQVVETSAGAQNTLPAVAWFYPPDGAQMASTTVAMSWMPTVLAVGYQFQLDDSNDFASPLISTTLEDASFVSAASIAPGSYYWRVSPVFASGVGAWTAAQIQTVALPTVFHANSTYAINEIKLLSITWQLQRKDTQMLCLDGDNEIGSNAWDRAHFTRGIHGKNNCARASIAMLASYYGGKLSQDRIAYEIFGRNLPEGDLGHNQGVSYPQINSALAWALNVAVPISHTKPSFAQIKAWIDANQPVPSTIPGHMRVIDGYWEWSGGPLTFQFLHVLDPWDTPKWIAYESDRINAVWMPPAGANGAPSVRSDEDVDGDKIADTVDDSDSDGVTDFDETHRFGLSPQIVDTDNDLVNDKADIRGYVFLTDGSYSPIGADIDGDGLRKEWDRDNDALANDASIDGCEDSNHDGKTNLGESSNYDPKDDMAFHLLLSWPKLGADVDLHLVQPGGAINTLGDCYFDNRSPDWGVASNVCDDPRLDVDCISQCTIENIRLSSPVTGTYSIKVHYYSDHGRGPTPAQVTLWLKGVPHTYQVGALAEDQVWEVGTIQWPSMIFMASDNVRHITLSERVALSAK